MDIQLKCLLLDDELPGLTYLKMLCEQLPGVEVVKAFNNPRTFLSEAQKLDFNLCVMDIDMPEMSGLQVAQLMKDKPVIFVTAHKEYAAEAFDLNAVDYVRKPIIKERLQHAFEKAKNSIQNSGKEKKFIQLNTDKGKTILFFDQIDHVQTSVIDSRDKIARMSDGTTFTLKNIAFAELQKLLPSKAFVRINKKEIIALKCVQFFSFNEITTTLTDSEGKTIKCILSEAYKSDFLKRVDQ